MAGRRRRDGKPLQRLAKDERRKQALNARLAATTDPLERIAIAADYYRAVFAQHPNPDAAERVVELLVESADNLRVNVRKEER